MKLLLLILTGEQQFIQSKKKLNHALLHRLFHLVKSVNTELPQIFNFQQSLLRHERTELTKNLTSVGKALLRKKGGG